MRNELTASSVANNEANGFKTIGFEPTRGSFFLIGVIHLEDGQTISTLSKGRFGGSSIGSALLKLICSAFVSCISRTVSLVLGVVEA